MRLLRELSMAKNTKIEWMGVTNNRDVAAITLADDTQFMLYVTTQENDADGVSEWLGKRLGHWYFKTEKIYEMQISFIDQHGRYTVDPKAKGVSLQLFAAIEHIFKKDILGARINTFDYIFFGGDEMHSKLYSYLVKRIMKSNLFIDASGEGEFLLIKKSSLEK